MHSSVLTKKIAKYTRDAGIILAISLFLLIAINWAAYYYLEHTANLDEEASLFISSRSAQGLEIRKRVFNTEDETVLEAYTQAPGIRPHSVLHFTEGASRPYYSVGVEGIRYLSNWSDEIVTGVLAQKKQNVFVFGGSTTFGHGVPDDDTVVAY